MITKKRLSETTPEELAAITIGVQNGTIPIVKSDKVQILELRQDVETIRELLGLALDELHAWRNVAADQRQYDGTESTE